MIFTVHFSSIRLLPHPSFKLGFNRNVLYIKGLIKGLYTLESFYSELN